MTAEANTPVMVRRMPFVLEATMGVHAALAAWLAFTIATAPLGLLEYTVNDRAVTGIEFLRYFGIAMAAFAALSAAVAYALRRERGWGREAIMVWCGSAAAALFFVNAFHGEWEQGLEAAGSQIIGLGLYGWYLYGKRSVRSYYSAIAYDTQTGRPNVATNGEHSA